MDSSLEKALRGKAARQRRGEDVEKDVRDDEMSLEPWVVEFMDGALLLLLCGG